MSRVWISGQWVTSTVGHNDVVRFLPLEEMFGMARPLAYGYLSVPSDASDDQARRWQQEIATFVDDEGHDLAGVFTDVRGKGATAFEAMSRALELGAVTEVVVPRLDHLEHVPGFGPADVRLLCRYLHATVVAVEEPVEEPVGAARH
jgi:hypothetical protein